MGFKLVRLDATEPYKVALPIGLHVIGRGSEKLFLEFSDSRVGRVHADINVTEDTVLLKSHNRNPCYVKKKSSEETIIFSFPDSQVLCNGDKFGLLPDKFWYEVIRTDELFEPTECKGNVQDNEKAVNQDNDNGDKDNKTQSYNSKDYENLNNSESLLGDVPPLQQDNQSSTAIESEIRSDNSPKDDCDNECATIPPTESDRATTPNKRVHSEEDSPCDVKRVKTEPEESPNKDSKGEVQPNTPKATASTEAVKTEPGSPQDVKPGPSNDQGGPSNDGNDNSADRAPSPAKPQVLPLRERCMYGINCYRRNPQHKAQFSHPADADWGAGARGVCPRGARCRKQDPRHWAGHAHPPGVQPPPRAPGNRPGMQLVRRHGNNYYINANAVHFYDDHFEVEDSDGDSVDFDYEF